MSTGFELPGEEGSEEMGGQGSPPEVGGGSPKAVPRFGSVRRGYDPGEVDAFLTQVASAIQVIEARIRDAPEAPEDTPQDVDERLAARFAGILAVQERETENLLAEAHLEAEAMVVAAEQDAERIRADGQDTAERSIGEAAAFRRRAAAEAHQLRVDLDERRRDMTAKLPQIQQRLVTFLRDLEKTLGSIEDPDGDERSNIEHVVDEHSSTSNA